MIGAVIIVIVLLVGIPVSLFVAGAGIAAGLGFLANADAAHRHEGSELLDLNI